MYVRSLLATVLFVGSLVQAAVWESANQWDENWEKKYSQWVTQNVTTDMFINIKSPYYGIATDCADLAYYTRVIFAAENSLPFVVNTRWGKNEDRISNLTGKFDKVSDEVKSVKFRNDQGQIKEVQLLMPLRNGKLRAFITALGLRVGTWSLPQDTYPISINNQNLRAGAVYLRQGYNRMTTWEAIQTFLTGTPPNPQEGPGHALMVFDVRTSGAIEFVQSTLPKKVRELSMIYEIELLPTNSKLGFRRFIQPDQVGQDQDQSLIGFSTEQFSELGREVYQNQNCNGDGAGPECWGNQSQQKSNRRNITEFRKDVMKLLATRAESSEEKQDRLTNTLCGAIRQRADVILTAEPYRLRFKNACMDAGSYDSFSTPSRDEQIRQFIKQMNFWSRRTTQLLEKCGSVKIDYTGKLHSIESLVSNFRSGKISSNPNERIDARWGFGSETSKCPEPK